MLFALGKVFSKATLQWIETADPNAGVNGSDFPIRKYYRWLINVAGVYYYVSIPVVVFLVLVYGRFGNLWFLHPWSHPNLSHIQPGRRVYCDRLQNDPLALYQDRI